LQTNSKPNPETPTSAQVPNPTGEVWTHPSGHIPEIVDAQRGIVKFTRKKIAIVGFASSTRHLAPFDDDTYTIMALNQLYRHIKRADVWFDIHENYDEHVVEGTDHVGWLKDCQIPVYMNECHQRYPCSVRYPIEAVLAYFGHDYFTSTIAFMIALAIMEKPEEIAIYGVDLIVGTEWETQRQCAEYYIGWARGMGIKVVIPEASSLLTQRSRYGYQVRPDDLLHTDDFVTRHTRVKERRDQLQIHLALLDGAMQEDDFHFTEIRQRAEAMTEEEAVVIFANERLQPRAKAIKTKRDEIQSQLLMLDGALQEDEYWKSLYELRERGGAIYSSE